MAVPIADLCRSGVSRRTAPQRRRKKMSPSSLAMRQVEGSHHTTRKRSRPIHDVDGPFTGPLSCKKRRLRRDLITSRLSQPFSLPATHILNRETTAGGELFLRRAAAAASNAREPEFSRGAQGASGPPGSIPTQKIRGHGPAEMILRVAMLNRIRLRVCGEMEGRGRATVDVKERDMPPRQDLVSDSVEEPMFPSTTEPSETDRTARTSGARPTPPKPSRSPELRALRGHAARPINEDQGDEDSLSFPSSNYIEDLADVEDVYADFGVIFGGAAEKDAEVGENGPVTGTLHAAEHLEEFMDDLDGIPPEARR